MIKKYILFLIFVFITSSCNLNKVIKHHGTHDLKVKSDKLIINEFNKNDVFKILGPAAYISDFDINTHVYIERKTTSSRLSKLGEKKLLLNDVLIVEYNDRGILISKNLLNKKDMNDIVFVETTTTKKVFNSSQLQNILQGLKQKINDPLGKNVILVIN